MSKEINIARNITNLRKKHKITQEQLAEALKVSPQAVSRWETASCQPDISTVPLIAEYFQVSIDYLFYGHEKTNNSIYGKVTDWVAAQPIQTEATFEEALKLSGAAQYGILFGYDRDPKFIKKEGSIPPLNQCPLHLLNNHGLSLFSQKGFSAIVTDDFLNSINSKTIKRANRIFKALADEDCLHVTIETLNFHDISWPELKEKTGLDEDRLRNAVEKCKKAGFIEETESIHSILRSQFRIQRHHYNCLFLIVSTIKMIETSLQGAYRHMYYPKFSISLKDIENQSSSTDAKPSDNPQ